jgi:hypothetical protein
MARKVKSVPKVAPAKPARWQIVDIETGRKECVCLWDGKTELALPGKRIEPDDGTPVNEGDI